MATSRDVDQQMNEANRDLLNALNLDPANIIEGFSVERDGTFTYQYIATKPPLGEVVRLEKDSFPTARAEIAPSLAEAYVDRVEAIFFGIHTQH